MSLTPVTFPCGSFLQRTPVAWCLTKRLWNPMLAAETWVGCGNLCRLWKLRSFRSCLNKILKQTTVISVVRKSCQKLLFKLKYNDLISEVDEMSGKRRLRGCIGKCRFGAQHTPTVKVLHVLMQPKLCHCFSIHVLRCFRQNI